MRRLQKSAGVIHIVQGEYHTELKLLAHPAEIAVIGGVGSENGLEHAIVLAQRTQDL